jgi:hypothetical protein
MAPYLVPTCRLWNCITLSTRGCPGQVILFQDLFDLFIIIYRMGPERKAMTRAL